MQDKYYQLAYINFLGGLLAKLDLSSCAPARTHDDFDKLAWETLGVLAGALTNIRREIEFYDETAEKYRLELQQEPPNETTKAYIRLFEEAGAPETPMLHGLVVLWATENVSGFEHARATDTHTRNNAPLAIPRLIYRVAHLTGGAISATSVPGRTRQSRPPIRPRTVTEAPSPRCTWRSSRTGRPRTSEAPWRGWPAWPTRGPPGPGKVIGRAVRSGGHGSWSWRSSFGRILELVESMAWQGRIACIA